MSPTRTKKQKPTAANADRYSLYEGSVYDPDADHDFLIETYQEKHKKRPLLLREDFAGTSLLSSMWVQRHRNSKAWAIDIDPEPLDWGKCQHLDKLNEQEQPRITQIQANVLDVSTPAVDVLTAFNFSYWCFKDRTTMLNYFKKAYAALNDNGMFAIDLMGGPSSQSACEEEREEDGFDYVWEQENMCAISHDIKCYIHFNFYDGTKFEKAFTYDWRLWSLAELRDIMMDAGFKSVDTYWEGTDDDGDGDGVYTLQQNAENEESWVAYLVAWK
ncbi:MAG: class I SAM-dependent methyltransferase [Planctomycetota bacterium]|jgi:hypothetical protein|nr:class I SAM-dependent methyltransferase [Planctomycetota bacterium]